MKHSGKQWRRREILTTIAVGGVSTIGLAGRLAAPAYAKNLKGTGEVVVYDSGGAMGVANKKAFMDPFELETGIKVISQPRSTAGAIRAGILAGSPKYDVISCTGGNYYDFAAEGLLLPIDYKWWDQADIDAIGPVPVFPNGVPNDYYSLIIGYDKKVGPTPKNWSEFWDTKNFPGPRSLAPGGSGSQGATFELALLADGVSPDQIYPIDWDRAFKSLNRIKPSILKWWASGAESIQLLIDRQVSGVSAWNGRLSVAQEQDANIASVWNQGVLQWDVRAVPKGALNIENAMKYLAFVSQPKQQAAFAQAILYGPVSTKAAAYLTSERLSQLPTSPELRKVQIVQDYNWWSTRDSNGGTNERRATIEWEKWITGSR